MRVRRCIASRVDDHCDDLRRTPAAHRILDPLMFSRLRLGTQLWVVVSLLLAAAAAGLTVYLTQVQTRALATATEQRLAIKEDALRAEAALLARNAALASASAALTLDFDFLQGVIAKTVDGDDTIDFGYIVDAKDEIV